MSCALSGQLITQGAAMATLKLGAQVLCLIRSGSIQAALSTNCVATGSTRRHMELSTSQVAVRN